MNFRQILPFLFVLLVLSPLSLYSQERREPQDSLVRLVEARSANIEEINGVSYRKVIGNARFLHNNTYLLCDTAYWNVNENVIKAIGNVQVIQENTFLTSDKIDYIIDENLAKFRGTLVELYDKEGNVLRTNYLDYNTRDSIGTFFNGGVMRGSAGNIIESNEGWYFAYEKLFSFEDNVQMFTDSVFIKTNKLEYSTVDNKAFFGKGTTAWQEDNMLTTNNGEFDRQNNIFHFKKDSYILTKKQELWADTLFYFRNTGNADLYGNIQILDTEQSAYAFADRATFSQTPFEVTLTKEPSVAMYGVENGVRDTLFLAADTLKYYHIRFCDIDSSVVEQAKSRVELSNTDPMIAIESESQQKRVDKKQFSNFITPKKNRTDSLETSSDLSGITSDSLVVLKDSLVAGADSLSLGRDSLEIKQLDTTAVAFIDAWHNVKVFRNDLQALCDSLVYTGLDSMARMYVNPVMWSELRHQFTSDSMQLIIKNNTLSKANLLSNAFIASQEDTLHYNQIKGTEMVAYFRDSDLYRFDALGGASMIFYLREDSLVTMMNQKEGKIISARLKNREIERIKYIESLKNDAYPVFNLPIENQRLKGFNWRGDERPSNRFEIVDRSIRKSKKETIKRRRFPNFPHSATYFPQEREAILAYKHKSDSLRLAKELAKMQMPDSVMTDSVTVEPVVKDSLVFEQLNDSISIVKDSLVKHDIIEESAVVEAEIISANDVRTAKEIRKAERLKRKNERKAKRLARKEQRTLKREQRKIKRHI
ncbi:MAG: hypothetical protein IKY70_06915 [Bacteroidales bacterium]|nr:hypothetical protein [Bacteroidales bacterium]